MGDVGMNSMTGYGRATAECDGRQLTVEIKTVNHRFLDLNARLPRSFAFLEDEMRAQIGGKLSRGHVDVFFTYKNLREDAKRVMVDRALLGAYLQALNEAQEAFALTDDRTLMGVARLGDVLAVCEAEEDQQALRALMREALAGALTDLCAMREREGASLRADLLSRLAALEELVQKIEARYPETVNDYLQRLKERIRELIAQDVDEQRLLQEAAIMADKSAIAEETVRLHSHIAQMREATDLNAPAGRKLDFIVQELNREVNTISSKSQDIPITQLVVLAKAEIEKMREQVQNIE